MPRVVDQGPRVFTASCGRCRCRFEYRIDELFTNYIRGREGVLCPRCSVFHVHEAR